MLIIMEGIDCVGKDWMSMRLLKAIPNCFYLKHGNRPLNDSSEERGNISRTYLIMLDVHTQIIDPHGGHSIFNRYYPSELVYSFVKRGYDAFIQPPDSLFYKNLLEPKVIKLDHLLVYVEASVEDIKKRMVHMKEDYMEIQDIPELINRYKIFLEITKLNFIKVRSGQPAIEEIIQIVKGVQG